MKAWIIIILISLVPLIINAQQKNMIELVYKGKTYYTEDELAWQGIKKVVIEDIDNDGEKEYILGVQARVDDVEIPEGRVFICNKKNNTYIIKNEISTGDYYSDFELIDIDKDGSKDIVAKGHRGAHYFELNIVSFKNGKYKTLWDVGSPSGVFLEFNKNGVPTIKIGIPLLYKKDWSFADDPDWEIWTWNGKKFVYTNGKTKKSRIDYIISEEFVEDYIERYKELEKEKRKKRIQD